MAIEYEDDGSVLDGKTESWVVSDGWVPDDFFDEWTHQGPESDDEEDTFEYVKLSYEVLQEVVTSMLHWAELMGVSF